MKAGGGGVIEECRHDQYLTNGETKLEIDAVDEAVAGTKSVHCSSVVYIQVVLFYK